MVPEGGTKDVPIAVLDSGDEEPWRTKVPLIDLTMDLYEENHDAPQPPSKSGAVKASCSSAAPLRNIPPSATSSGTRLRAKFGRPLLQTSLNRSPSTPARDSPPQPIFRNDSEAPVKISPHLSIKTGTATWSRAAPSKGPVLAPLDTDDSSQSAGVSDQDSSSIDNVDSNEMVLEEEDDSDEMNEDEFGGEELEGIESPEYLSLRSRLSPNSFADENDLDIDTVMRDSSATPTKRPSRNKPSLRKSPPTSIPDSIGDSSPLLQRLKQQRSKGPLKTSARDGLPKDENQEKSIEEDPADQVEIKKLQEKLEKFIISMQDDHATTVRWLLKDARMGVENNDSLFIDQVSPFAGLKPVTFTPESIVPKNATTITIDSHFSKKKIGKARVKVITTTISDGKPRVPRYYSHTAVRRNVLSPNDEKLRYIPFLGDIQGNQFTKLVKELDEHHQSQQQESGRRSEQLAHLRAYVDSWLKDMDLNIDRKQLLQYFFNQSSAGIELEREQRKVLSTPHKVFLDEKTVRDCNRFCRAFDRVCKHSLRDVIVEDRQLKESLEPSSKKGSNSTTASPKDVRMEATDDQSQPAENRLDTYAGMVCTICGVIWCQSHGDYTQQTISKNEEGNESGTTASDDEEEVLYDFRPVIMRYDDLLRKQDVRLAEKPPDMELSDMNKAPCSQDCFRAVDFSNWEYQVSPDERSRIRGMVISLREKRTNVSCDVSFLLNLPCWQVEAEIRKMKPRVVEVKSPGRRKDKLDWYDNKRKILKGEWGESSRAHLHHNLAQANPCAHDGPCLINCQCYNSNVLCEALCGCSDECSRRWTGCTCHASGMLCTNESCICIQMNRECGPQCVSCGAIPRINPANKHHDELFTTGCQNINLQRGVPRKVVLGESQLAGFGLYLAEPLKKGQFIMEYAGEVVSGNEAERRGIIYDRKLLSFLFDLNAEWVVDAARLGNNSRFINHAETERDGLNCEAKIMLVNGEHRIKFFALKDLKAGDELLFNYGKKFAERHGLTKKLPTANKGGRVVGEEELAKLDGVNLERRKRGGARVGGKGRGGVRGRKARKTAQDGRVKEVEKGEDLEAGDHTTEDDGDSGGKEGRGKRKIRKPSRYTR